MYRFVPDSVGGVGSRRSSRKSCDSCKRRHKRCLHVRRPPPADQLNKSPSASTLHSRQLTSSNDLVDGDGGDARNSHSTIRETQPLSESQVSPSSRPNKRLSDSSAIRFIGNLSPEASFFATGNTVTDSEDHRTKVGVWLVARQTTSTHHQDATTNTEDNHASTFFPLSNPYELQNLFLLLQKEWMSVLPPEHEFSILFNLYFAKFDPIFPIVHGENLEELDNPERSALKQCICLIASLDPSMKSYLRLAHSEGVLSQRQFRSRIAETLKSTLYMGIIRNKTILLQITALLAFFVNEPSSSEISSHFTAQAVERSQTLGLHVSYPDESEGLEKSHRLFWCIWALDRLNAATNGRPTLINEQDTGEQLLNFVPEHLPSFRLFIRICKFLDEVISYYRPRPVLHTDLSRSIVPDFESLVCEAAAAEVSSSLMASLEIFYLSVRILACRPHTQSNGPNQVPSSDAQFASAASILSLASGDFKSSMTYWVALPYAVSLALSVEYQTLRNSKLSYSRRRAYHHFHQSRQILEGLSETFVSARTMAQLSQDTLKEASKPRGHTSRTGEEFHLATGDTQRNTFKDIGSSSLSHSTPPNLNDSPIIPLNHFDHLYQTNHEEFGISENLSLSELDNVLDGFDGDIDLSRIDTLFSTNLNPTLPLIATDWMNFEHVQ
ncbi:hypothetical protein BDV39DRAFT_213614 [Aspergillus sergii]|uniref:Xylanolytic transcriptional activator regulatory domain-containing protein n=1 Tax=Aspergillus sergii TaxID=1034303 RepID=A0A5N6XE70_9EURO|nr:hypothetical protein BDV39DRAFT_213614 [Aspergillus sergii]